MKQIGDEFSFKPRDELDDEEKRLMKDVELARQSRKIMIIETVSFCEIVGEFLWNFKLLIGFNFKQNITSQICKEEENAN